MFKFSCFTRGGQINLLSTVTMRNAESSLVIRCLVKEGKVSIGEIQKSAFKLLKCFIVM